MTRVVETSRKKNVTSVVRIGQKTVVLSPETPRTVVEVSDIGLPGPKGDAGISGGHYVHTQSVPSASWTITHDLGYYPGGVSIVDSGGTKVYGDVTFISQSTLVVTFNAAFSGKAYLS
jgi:hypothetical protein